MQPPHRGARPHSRSGARRGSDQNGYEACTAHALAEGVAQSCAAAGKAIAIPSQALLWAAAKSQERTPNPDGSLPVLGNGGVQSVSCMFAIGTLGVVPMLSLAPGRFSDVQDATYEAPFNLGQRAMGTLVTGEYSLDPTNAGAPEQIAIVLDHGISVYLAANVDDAYDNWRPGMPPLGAPSVNGAGHAIILDGYTSVSGGYVFTSPGSYGTGYADDGVWTLAGSWVVANGFDCYPLAVAGVHYA